MIIIDEKYEGIEKRGDSYYIDNLITTEPVKITVNIKVLKSLEVGKSLYVSGSLEVDGLLDVGEFLDVEDSLIVKGLLIVRGGSIKVGGEIVIMGVKTSYVICIPETPWSILVLSDHIRIGCQFHTKDAWKNFTYGEIDSMHPKALNFWIKNKERILQIGE